MLDIYLVSMKDGSHKGRDVDLLFGLDMLKAHQACIDLERNVLRIQGREVKFLAEHELPDKARFPEETVEIDSQAAGSSTENRGQQASKSKQQFPGGGNVLGRERTNLSQGPSSSRTSYSESDIKTLMDLGTTQEAAIRALDATNGNVEYAASILFSTNF